MVEGLRALIDAERDLKVVGTTTDPRKVAHLVTELGPDVLVLDMDFGGMTAGELLGELRRLEPSPRVLILTAYNDGDSIRSVLDAGADGLALKTESPKVTLAAIRQVHAGQLVFPQAARRWLKERRNGPADITPREHEVWTLLGAGLTNAHIAERLHLSDNTVKFHLQNLFLKLGVNNRTEAALKYVSMQPPSARSRPAGS